MREREVEVIRPSAPCGGRLFGIPSGEAAEAPCVVKPCHRFGLKVRVGITLLRLGAAIGSINTHIYPKISSGGRPVAEERQLRGDSAHATEPVMAVAASQGRRLNRKGETGVSTFPIRDPQWRKKTHAGPEASEYIALCRRMGGFPFGDLQSIETAGASLAQKAGGAVQAAREIHPVRFRELRYARGCAERAKHHYPEIADGVMSIYTDGAVPKYSPSPPKSAPGDGYPRNPDRNMKIMESARRDTLRVKSFIFETTSLTYGERLESIPATTVRKRMPDRSFSGRPRAISDLRMINLGVGTGDFPPPSGYRE